MSDPLTYSSFSLWLAPSLSPPQGGSDSGWETRGEEWGRRGFPRYLFPSLPLFLLNSQVAFAPLQTEEGKQVLVALGGQSFWDFLEASVLGSWVQGSPPASGPFDAPQRASPQQSVCQAPLP